MSCVFYNRVKSADVWQMFKLDLTPQSGVSDGLTPFDQLLILLTLKLWLRRSHFVFFLLQKVVLYLWIKLGLFFYIFPQKKVSAIFCIGCNVLLLVLQVSSNRQLHRTGIGKEEESSCRIYWMKLGNTCLVWLSR